jgi:hypothetical protein
MSTAFPADPKDSMPTCGDSGIDATLISDEVATLKNQLVFQGRVSSNNYCKFVGFDSIPVVIFDIIHSYLSHYDYRQFLNCSNTLFYPIKFETVVYELLFFESWNKSLEFYETAVVGNVKDKSKQIKLCIYEPSVEQFQRYESLLEGLAKVEIDFTG